MSQNQRIVAGSQPDLSDPRSSSRTTKPQMARVATQNSHKALQIANVNKAQQPASVSSRKHTRQTSKSGSGSDKMWQYLDEGIQFGKSSNKKSHHRPSISDTKSKTQRRQGASPQTAAHRPVQPHSNARPNPRPNRPMIDNRSTTTLEHNQQQQFRMKRQKLDEEAQHWSLIGEIKHIVKSSLLDRAERKAATDRRARREAARLAKLRTEKALIPTPIYDQFRSHPSQYRQTSPSQRAETASLQRPKMALTRSKKEATPGEWSAIRRKPVPMHEQQQQRKQAQGQGPKVRPGAQQSVTVVENPLSHRSVYGIKLVSRSPPLSKKQKADSGGTDSPGDSHADLRQNRQTRLADFMNHHTSSPPPLPVKDIKGSSPTKKTGYQLSRCGVCGQYETREHPLLLANDIWFCATCFDPCFGEEIPPPPPPKDDRLYQPVPMRPIYNARLSSRSSIEEYMSERPESPLSMMSRRGGHRESAAAPSLLSQELDHRHNYHEDSGYSDDEAPPAVVDPRGSTWAPTDITPLGPDDSVSVRNWGRKHDSYYATPAASQQKGKGAANLPPPVPLKGYKARVASSIYPEDEAPKPLTAVPDVPVIPTKFLDGPVREDEGFLLKNMVYGQAVPAFKQEDVDAEVWRSEWMEGEEEESENDWDNRKSSFYGPIHEIVNEHSRQM